MNIFGENYFAIECNACNCTFVYHSPCIWFRDPRDNWQQSKPINSANCYAVETRNGNIKTIFKIFQKEWCNITLPHLMTDIRICAALINVYFKTVESNKGIDPEILATRMLNRLQIPNLLSTIISRDTFRRKLIQFDRLYDFEELPTLTKQDLFWISLGNYQIQQAASYCHEHFKANESQFVIFVCPNEVCQTFFADFFFDGRQPKLLMARLKSRYRSNKSHDVYVLVDTLGQGEESVLTYCCACYNGLRTVGCCTHVMSIIWYSLHIKSPENMRKPAAFLNDYFANESSSDFESDDD